MGLILYCIGGCCRARVCFSKRKSSSKTGTNPFIFCHSPVLNVVFDDMVVGSTCQGGSHMPSSPYISSFFFPLAAACACRRPKPVGPRCRCCGHSCACHWVVIAPYCHCRLRIGHPRVVLCLLPWLRLIDGLRRRRREGRRKKRDGKKKACETHPVMWGPLLHYQNYIQNG